MTSGRGKFFGVPLGDFGLLTSLLMAVAFAVLIFFLVTFLSILGIGIYNSLGHTVNYADSYKIFSLPAGCVALAIGLVFFGTLWVRRKISGS
jgi:hypothetical protein